MSLKEEGKAALLRKLEDLGADPVAALEETFMGDWALYEEYLSKFPEDENMEEFRKALEGKRLTDAFRFVHTLKGIADSFGLFPLVDAAVGVQLDLRAGNWEDACNDRKELEENYRKFSDVLREAFSES